jgi:hypothetical protein
MNDWCASRKLLLLRLLLQQQASKQAAAAAASKQASKQQQQQQQQPWRRWQPTRVDHGMLRTRWRSVCKFITHNVDETFIRK